MPDSGYLDRTLGSAPLVCFDIGARGGIQKHWEPFAKHMQVDAFEPDAAAYEAELRKQTPGIAWFQCGIGGSVGEAPLYVLNKESSSSLYPPNPTFHDAYTHRDFGTLKGTIPIKLTTLSHHIDENRRPLPHLLKLDIQGAELDVLKAMRDEHWRDVLALQVEVEFVDIYVGQPLFHDVDLFVQGRGFDLFDLLPARRYRVAETREHHYLKKHLNIARNRHDISCRLVAGDAFYLRPASFVWESGDERMIARYLVILLAYRCYDEALWFIEESVKKDKMTKSDARAMISFVQSLSPRPDLLQRGDFFGKWARRLRKRFNLGSRKKKDYWLDRSWDF